MNSHTDNRISMNNSDDDLCVCPSFNCYSTDKLAEIAIKVAAENQNNNDDEYFEFSLVREDKEELFYGGDTGPIYPVFNRDILLNNGGGGGGGGDKQPESSITIPIPIPLSKLFMENERDDPPSCSSSEADELDNVPAGTYCVWRPKAAETTPSPSICKKSKSTGSVSKRWKFSDLLRRSNSEGKDSFVFMTPKHKEEKVPEKLIEAKGKRSGGGGSGGSGSPSAHEALYVRNRAVKEGNKKKSYLPYRQDLVGFFVNANGLGKSFPHF